VPNRSSQNEPDNTPHALRADFTGKAVKRSALRPLHGDTPPQIQSDYYNAKSVFLSIGFSKKSRTCNRSGGLPDPPSIHGWPWHWTCRI